MRHANQVFLDAHQPERSWRTHLMGAGFAWWMSALVFVTTVFFSELILYLYAAEKKSQQQGEALALASELSARMDRELSPMFTLSSGIVGYLVARQDRIDNEDIERIMQELGGFGHHLRSLTIALGYRVAYVYPLADIDGLLGRDYHNLADQWPQVKASIDSGKGALFGPVRIKQAGAGLVYRIPIFAGGKYSGMVSSEVALRSLEASVFKAFEGRGFDFAVRTGVSSGKGLLFGREELFSDASTVRFEAVMPGGVWEYAARPKDASMEVLIWGLRGIGGLLAGLAAAGVYTVLRQRSELARHAGLDSLTGLPNRRLFNDRLTQATRRQSRRGDFKVAVLFLDLNGFKAINDRYGHKFGDAVLGKVGARIREELRIEDTVARWAGDEFTVIIDEADPAGVTQLIRRLRQGIARPFRIGDVKLRVEASIGAAFFPDEATTPGALLELADQRMFADKPGAPAA